MAIKISGSTIIDDDRNIVNAGVVTATSFSGDGSNLTSVGIGSEGSINTSGIVTASKITVQKYVGYGDKLIFSPTVTSFSPTDGTTDVALDTNIVLTFNQLIYAGVGSIFLRNSSGIGTEIEAIGIGSTTQITISNQTLTINPSSDLPINTDVYVVLPQGVVTNSVGGNNALLDTYNFTTLDFALNSINPTNGATNVGLDTSITLSFTSAPTKGTGTVEIRSGSVGGTVVESFDAASSGQITVSGNDWILTPSSELNLSTTYYTIIPSTAIASYPGLNIGGGTDSHSFTTRDVAPGDAYEGGYLICQSGGTNWIVAPSSTQVSRTWYLRNDAVTLANANAACGDWFIPNCAQLKNPGSICKVYWDSTLTTYWSNTETDSILAVQVNLHAGNPGPAVSVNKQNTRHSRAFRCVSY